MTAKDNLYWDFIHVLEDNGHSRPRAKAIYAELLAVFERHLIDDRELHLKGLVTIRITARREQVIDGFTKRPAGEKIVVRAGASVRRRLIARIRQAESMKADSQIDGLTHEQQGVDS